MGATASLISVQEYLKTTADPDCEYVAGVIEERAVGEYDHATWQMIIAGYFCTGKGIGDSSAGRTARTNGA